MRLKVYIVPLYELFFFFFFMRGTGAPALVAILTFPSEDLYISIIFSYIDCIFPCLSVIFWTSLGVTKADLYNSWVKFFLRASCASYTAQGPQQSLPTEGGFLHGYQTNNKQIKTEGIQI